MPFTWNQVNTAPDIASTDRYRVYFPNVNGIDANILAMLVKSVTVPRRAIGHIKVKLRDIPFGFRGGNEFENVLTVHFHDNVRGDGTKNINKWMDVVRNVDGLSELRRTYAANGKLEIYNTVGKPFLTIPLLKMFPVSVDFPEFDDANSNAYEFTVDFNVDLADPKYG